MPDLARALSSHRLAAHSLPTSLPCQVWEGYISRGDFHAVNPYVFQTMTADGALRSGELWSGGGPPYWVWRTSLVYGITWRAVDHAAQDGFD